MAMMKDEGAVPDFLRMDQPVSSDPANAKKTGNWHGWPTKDLTPVTLHDDAGRTVRIRMIRGYAWSGAGAIDQVDVSVDGGETCHSAHIEQPRERFMWVRWSYRWDASRKGTYTLMSRATDEVGRVQSREPRYNNMRKNFSAIVGYTVTVE